MGTYLLMMLLVVDIEGTMQVLKYIGFVGAGLGVFVGAMWGGHFWTVRSFNKTLDPGLLKTVHNELTEKQNGSFRGEFSRFQVAVNKRLEQLAQDGNLQDQRMLHQDDRLMSIDERLNVMDRNNLLRFNSLDVKISKVAALLEGLPCRDGGDEGVCPDNTYENSPTD